MPKIKMLDISTHHARERIINSVFYDTEFLIEEINDIESEIDGWFKLDTIESATGIVAKHKYISHLGKVLHHEWPREHCKYMLQRAAELYTLSIKVRSKHSEPLTIQYRGRTLVIPSDYVSDSSTDNIEHIWDSVAANALARDGDGLKSILSMPEESFESCRSDLDRAYYRVLRLYFLNETDANKQQKALNQLKPFYQEGEIAKLVPVSEFENEANALYSSLCQLIEVIWMGDHQSIEQAVKEAIQKNFYGYAYSRAKQARTKVGSIDESYSDINATWHWHIMGIIATYFDRTGKKLSFSSAYMSDWIMYNEGPNGRELLDNPPEFSEAVVSAGRNQ